MIVERTSREVTLKQIEPRGAALRDAPDTTSPRLALGTREFIPIESPGRAGARSDAQRRGDEIEAPHDRQAMRDEDVAAIGHDLRAPLAVIALEVTLLAEKLPELSKGAKHALDRINRNLAYLDNLLHDLLDLSAIDAARFEICPDRIELCGLVADVVDRMVASRDRPRVNVSLNGMVFLSADARRIERVVSNLVHNALKFSPTTAQITVSIETDAQVARVSVVDGGPGLTAADAARVFEKFRRASSTTHREGNGLGLYVSRRIVEAHGGRIGVESVVGRGSRFYFELPLLETQRI